MAVSALSLNTKLSDAPLFLTSGGGFCQTSKEKGKQRMRKTIFTMLAASILLVLCNLPSFATNFAECPAVGGDTLCALSITINPGGSLSFALSGQGPFDGSEDTLVGVINNSGAVVPSISLSGNDIFGFDGDGACSGGYSPNPAFCPNLSAPTGYEGYDQNVNFDSFNVTNSNSGSVVFGGGGLAAGWTAWFSLENLPNDINGVSPEPSSLLLLGTGILGLFGRLRRRNS